MRRAFIADLHLSPATEAQNRLLVPFLEVAVAEFDELYLLGDLFEVWLGDDLSLPRMAPIIEALQRAHAAGLALYHLHGNRDFLLGAAFSAATGSVLLPEVVRLEGEEPILLLHGDLLCTEDRAYQQMRQQLRHPDWSGHFLAQPVEARLAIAAQLQQASREEKGHKPEAVMEVSPAAVAQMAQAYGVTTLIHGHTHRPGYTAHRFGEQIIHRYVVGEWLERGCTYLVQEEESFIWREWR